MTTRRRKRPAGHAFDLQLAGHTIGVYWVDNLKIDGEELAGAWRAPLDRIDLDSALSRTEAQEVLIHEGAHAVSDVYDLRLTERQIAALGLGLQQMLAPFLKVIR